MDIYEISKKYYDDGRKAMDQSNYTIAIELLKQSVDILPHYKAYELIGECYLSSKEYNNAILYLSAAAGLGNNQYRARYLLALSLIEINEEVDAIDKLEEAIRINSNYKKAVDLLHKVKNRP